MDTVENTPGVLSPVGRILEKSRGGGDLTENEKMQIKSVTERAYRAGVERAIGEEANMVSQTGIKPDREETMRLEVAAMGEIRQALGKGDPEVSFNHIPELRDYLHFRLNGGNPDLIPGVHAVHRQPIAGENDKVRAFPSEVVIPLPETTGGNEPVVTVPLFIDEKNSQKEAGQMSGGSEEKQEEHTETERPTDNVVAGGGEGGEGNGGGKPPEPPPVEEPSDGENKKEPWGSRPQNVQKRRAVVDRQPVIIGASTGEKPAEEPVKEPPKQEEKKKVQARTAMDYFRPGERASLTDLSDGAFARNYEAMLEGDEAARRAVIRITNEASRLRLTGELYMEVVEELADMPEKDRKIESRVAGRLFDRVDEIDERFSDRVYGMYRNGDISGDLAAGLDGYAKVQIMREAARLAAKDPIKGDAEVEKRTDPKRLGANVNELGINWQNAAEAAEKADEDFDGDEGKWKSAFAGVAGMAGVLTADQAIRLGAELWRKAQKKIIERLKGKGEETKTEENKTEEKKDNSEPKGEKEDVNEIWARNASFGDLQVQLMRESDSSKQEIYKREKQRRVDEVRELYKTGQTLESELDARLRALLAMSNEAYFRQPLETFRDQYRARNILELQESRLHGVVETVVDDEVRRVLADIYAAISDPEERKRRGISTEFVHNLQATNERSRVFIGVDIPNPRGILMRPLPHEEWIRMRDYFRMILPDAEWRALAESHERHEADESRPDRRGGGRENRGQENAIELPTLNLGWVTDEFLESRGIVNRDLYVTLRTGKTLHVDMVDYMERVFNTGDLLPEYMKDASIIAELQANFKTSADWDNFSMGVVPWMRMWFQNKGSYADLVNPNAKEGLAQGLSLHYTVAAFENDMGAKRALGIFLEMNGTRLNNADKKVEGALGTRVIDIPESTMGDGDKEFAHSVEDEFAAEMKKHHLDVEAGVQLSRKWIEGMAERVAAHVGCDKATALIASEMATVLNGTPKMLEYRKLNLVLPDNKGYGRFLLENPGEKIALPMLAQVFVGMRSNSPGEKAKPMFLADALNSGGVDGLLEVMKGKTNPSRLGQAIKARARVIAGMELAVDLAEGGQDSYSSVRERRDNRLKVLGSLLNEKSVPDILPETEHLILERKVYGENPGEPKQGKHRTAGMAVREMLRNLSSDLKDSL